MKKKTIFTMMLTSTISLCVAQDVVQEEKSINMKSNQSSVKTNADNKPIKIIGEPVLVKKEHSKKNEQSKIDLTPHLVSGKAAAEKYTTDNNK